MSENIVIGVLIVIGVTMFIEHILLLSWNYWYFTTGILIYQKRIFLSHTSSLTPAINHAQSAITPTFLHGSIEFNEIKPNILLLRNKHYEFRPFGFGRGTGTRRILFYNPTTGEIEVKGYLNWVYLPIWGAFFIMYSSILFEFTFLNLLLVIVSLTIFFIFSLYPAAIDSRVNDEVIYQLKTYFRKQFTSMR